MNDKSSLLNQLRLDRPTPPPGRPAWQWWTAGAAGVPVLAIAGWLLLAGPGGIPVRVAVAQAAAEGGGATAGATLLDASGYVVARRQATVSAKITDKVTEVLIEEGQHVDDGDIIAKLDDTNSLAALAQARMQVAEAIATQAAARMALADAEPIFRRQQKLLAQGWISGSAFDAAKASYDAAETNLEVTAQSLAVAKAGLEVAERNQDDTVVRAPYAGVVTVKAAQPGEIVSPFSAGGGFTRTGICTIVDMNSLEVEVDVSENFIHRVHADQPATVKLNAYPDWAIPAQVIAVIPTADRSKATVKVRVALKQKDPRILPEMGARVAFLSDAPAATPGEAAHGVVVPTAAVRGTGDTGVVFIIRGNTVERRAVRLGARTQDGQIILSGITSGDRLAIGDFGKLADGAEIHIDDTPAPGEKSS